MLGFGKRAPVEDPRRVMETERAKATVRDLLKQMHAASPEEAERLGGRVKDFLKTDKILPFDLRQKAFKRARSLECDSNMRSADALLHEAGKLAAEEKMKERGEKLGVSRRYFGKACTLGADEEWQKAYKRLTETVMMTGGVHHAGPTRAKPLDTAPKAPNRAKPDEEE